MIVCCNDFTPSNCIDQEYYMKLEPRVVEERKDHKELHFVVCRVYLGKVVT